MDSYRYKPEVLTALAGHGLIPKATTAPPQLRAVLNDLYRYELRQLRDRLIRRDFPRDEYADRVITLRKRYPLMSLPVEMWIEAPAAVATSEAEEQRRAGVGPREQ